MKTLFFTLILILTAGSFCFAAPRESGQTDAAPVVVYGKDSNGVLRPILTDTSGVVQGG
jgi:hypothetical protein